MHRMLQQCQIALSIFKCLHLVSVLNVIVKQYQWSTDLVADVYRATLGQSIIYNLFHISCSFIILCICTFPVPRKS